MDIHDAYSDVVSYARALEELLKELTYVDDMVLRAYRVQHIRPITNTAIELLEEKKR